MDDAWKTRLANAIEKSGKSHRQISLNAGLGPGYVHSILKENKDPTITNLESVCGEIGVTLQKIIYNIDLSPEELQILDLLADAPEETRKAVAVLLQPQK